jgi:hypothetical protein
MIIAIDASGKVSLTEANNFRGFKVVSSLTDNAKLGEALKAAGRYDGEHAWITKAWLIQHAPKDPNWRSEFDKMAAFAQSKGWVEGDAIRAHVEIAAT